MKPFLEKILEARRDFEEALSKLKGGRRKRDADSDSVVIELKSQFNDIIILLEL